ncbi:MAG: hypothetical protein NT141_00410 [candidate division WWE3 bacterium]|nr:hypothetical protein [candidate division WWE3 bacterium]
MQTLEDITVKNASIEFNMVPSERITEISESVAREASSTFNESFGERSKGRTTNDSIKEFCTLMDEFIDATIVGDADVFRGEKLSKEEIGFIAMMTMTTELFVTNRAREVKAARLGIKPERDDVGAEAAYRGAIFTHLVASVFLNNNVTYDEAKSFWEGLRTINKAATINGEEPSTTYIDQLYRGVMAEVATAFAIQAGDIGGKEVYEVLEPSRNDDLRNQLDLIVVSPSGKRIYVQCKGVARMEESRVTMYDPSQNYDWSQSKYDLSRLLDKAYFDRADLACLVEVGFASPDLEEYTGVTTPKGAGQIFNRIKSAVKDLDKESVLA